MAKRLAQHNSPDYAIALHTKRRRGHWRLVYSEACASRSAAMKREKQLKFAGGRRLIQSLVETDPA